jgi:hypothetical protein
MNRSMGQPDLYPFVLSPAVTGELAFIHEHIHASSERQSEENDQGRMLKAVIGGLQPRVVAPYFIRLLSRIQRLTLEHCSR